MGIQDVAKSFTRCQSYIVFFDLLNLVFNAFIACESQQLYSALFLSIDQIFDLQ